MAELPHFSVFRTVLSYSIFILLAPISTFFAVKYFFFESLLGTSNVTSNVWSAVFAVVVLHIGLGLFIYRAYYDSGKAKKYDKLEEKVD